MLTEEDQFRIGIQESLRINKLEEFLRIFNRGMSIDVPVRDISVMDSPSLQGKNYNRPARTQARCHICQSQSRAMIDKMIVDNYSYATITRNIIGKDPNLASSYDALRKSIERHAARHTGRYPEGSSVERSNSFGENGTVVEDYLQLENYIRSENV